MVLKMRMSFLVALVGILSLILVGLVNAQDEPCSISPGSSGIMIDSVHITDWEGYKQTVRTGWDPSYTVTEFGPGKAMFVIMNYTITDSDALPLKIKATFKGFGDRRVIQNKKNASASYRETQMYCPIGARAGVHKIRCTLRVKYHRHVVGWSKAVCNVTWSN